jgi:hypothetical protein
MLQNEVTASRSEMVRSLAITGAFVIATIVPVPSAIAQTSFPVVCHGGGGMRAEVLANGTLRVFFTPAGQGANTAPPAPGQCTWLDRAFRPGEPTVLLSNYGTARVFIDAMVSGGTFNAHVFNNNQGAMQVTRVGP